MLHSYLHTDLYVGRFCSITLAFVTVVVGVVPYVVCYLQGTLYKFSGNIASYT